MVSTDDDVRTLLPGHDCGICGSPTCATFARRLVLRRVRIDACLPLDAAKAPAIASLLEEGAVTGVCENPAPRGMIAINPCAEGGKVTLETQLKCGVKERGCSPFDLLDFQYLGGYLAGIEGANGLSASLEMGYAKFDLSGQRIHLFKRGKLIVRRADSRESALSILSTVAQAVWPSVICPDTGLTLSSSFYGQGCPFAWKPHDFACAEAATPPPARGFAGLPECEAYFSSLGAGSPPPGARLSAEVGRAFATLESPADAPRLLAVAGALEALARAGAVPECWDSASLSAAMREKRILPAPAKSPGTDLSLEARDAASPVDWRSWKSAYNLHLASAALLSILH